MSLILLREARPSVSFLCIAALGDLVSGCRRCFSRHQGAQDGAAGVCLEGELCLGTFKSKAYLGRRGLDCRAGARFQGNRCGRGESTFEKLQFVFFIAQNLSLLDGVCLTHQKRRSITDTTEMLEQELFHNYQKNFMIFLSNSRISLFCLFCVYISNC